MALVWNEREQAFDVVPGTCPSPWPGDDGSARACVQNGNCGCDEFYKHENCPAGLTRETGDCEGKAAGLRPGRD